MRVLWNGGEAFSIPFLVTSGESTATHAPIPGRYALLIGNSTYRNLPSIPSSAGDADLLGSALKQAGFDVTAKKDLTADEWKRTEREFMSKIDKDSVVVFYFSGYGLHEDSDNWLAPVSFDPGDSGPLSTKAYSVDRLRQLLEEKNVKLKVFLLNAAWRAAPLDTQAEKAGLATPEVDAQTIFSFAVAPGRTLPVDTQTTSLFARTLADLVNKSGSDISQLLTVELPQREASAGGAPMTFMDNPPQFRFSMRPTVAVNGPAGFGSGGGIGSPQSPGLGAYKIGAGISPPAPIYKPEPNYSEEARKAKYEGTVVLAIVIDENGNVRQTHVVRSLGLGLDEKATEAVQKWKFRPGMKDGRPVPVQATIQVNFRLHKDPNAKSGAGSSLLGKWSIHDSKFDVPPGAQGPRLLKASLDQLPRMSYATNVTVTLEIDADGHAQNVDTDAPPPFDIAPVLVAAIRNWSFAPAQQDGKPVAVHGTFHLSYQTDPAGGVIGGLPSASLPPVPKITEGGPEPPSVHTAAGLQEEKLTHRVAPVYPPLAQQARIQGTVLFAAIIAKDGAVRELRLISGHPLLVAAAENAVKQWQYTPTLLNGEPVEVRTTIQVQFTLSQ